MRVAVKHKVAALTPRFADQHVKLSHIQMMMTMDNHHAMILQL